jgi:hypothetical protein
MTHDNTRTNTNHTLTTLDLPIPPLRAVARGLAIVIAAGIALLLPQIAVELLDSGSLFGPEPWYIRTTTDLLSNDALVLLWRVAVVGVVLVRYGRLRDVLRDRRAFLTRTVLGCFAAVVGLRAFHLLTSAIGDRGELAARFATDPAMLLTYVADNLAINPFAWWALLVAFTVLSLQGTVGTSGDYRDYRTHLTELAVVSILFGVWNGCLNAIEGGIEHGISRSFLVYLPEQIFERIFETAYFYAEFGFVLVAAFIGANLIQKRRSGGDPTDRATRPDPITERAD